MDVPKIRRIMTSVLSGAAIAGSVCVTYGSAEAQPASVPRIWQGVTGIGVLCLVTTEKGVDTGALRDRLCTRVRDIAKAGSPAPVAVIAIGDRSILAPDRVTLLVHASVRADAGRRLMAFSIRPYRNDADDPGLLFGAEPRAIALSPSPNGRDGLDDALAQSLAQTLPWLSRPAARPIP